MVLRGNGRVSGVAETGDAGEGRAGQHRVGGAGGIGGVQEATRGKDVDGGVGE